MSGQGLMTCKPERSCLAGVACHRPEMARHGSYARGPLPPTARGCRLDTIGRHQAFQAANLHMDGGHTAPGSTGSMGSTEHSPSPESGEYSPSGQSVQLLAPAAEYVPAPLQDRGRKQCK